MAMETINEDSLRHGPEDSSENKDDKIELNSQKFQIDREKDRGGTRPDPLGVLNHVRLNNTLETPGSTIKGVFNYSAQTELQFNRKNLKKVEEQLKRVFIEFYQKLRLLKNYRLYPLALIFLTSPSKASFIFHINLCTSQLCSFLNTLAFSKIMKKYDKVFLTFLILKGGTEDSQ